MIREEAKKVFGDGGFQVKPTGGVNFDDLTWDGSIGNADKKTTRFLKRVLEIPANWKNFQDYRHNDSLYWVTRHKLKPTTELPLAEYIAKMSELLELLAPKMTFMLDCDLSMDLKIGFDPLKLLQFQQQNYNRAFRTSQFCIKAYVNEDNEHIMDEEL